MASGCLYQGFRAIFRPARYRWWHGVGIGLAANLAFGMLGRRGQDREYYERLKQAPFAPPSGSFVPVWAINNASVVWGNVRLLNLSAHTPHRRALIGLQAASWVLFSTFGYVYFRRGSVILGFAWTAAHWALTVASVVLGSRLDCKIALSLTSTLAWLSLATMTTAYQAARNADGLFGTPPLIP